MIAPLTGNGMSMAIESGILAADPIEAYARGSSDWRTTTARVQSRWKVAFHGRLKVASILQHALFWRSRLRYPITALAFHPVPWRWLFHWTRY